MSRTVQAYRRARQQGFSSKTRAISPVWFISQSGRNCVWLPPSGHRIIWCASRQNQKTIQAHNMELPRHEQSGPHLSLPSDMDHTRNQRPCRKHAVLNAHPRLGSGFIASQGPGNTIRWWVHALWHAHPLVRNAYHADPLGVSTRYQAVPALTLVPLSSPLNQFRLQGGVKAKPRQPSASGGFRMKQRGDKSFCLPVR